MRFLRKKSKPNFWKLRAYSILRVCSPWRRSSSVGHSDSTTTPILPLLLTCSGNQNERNFSMTRSLSTMSPSFSYSYPGASLSSISASSALPSISWPPDISACISSMVSLITLLTYSRPTGALSCALRVFSLAESATAYAAESFSSPLMCKLACSGFV